MTLFRTVVFTLLLQVATAAQRTTPGSIEGVVVRLGTGQPVAKAVVAVEAAAPAGRATASGPRPDVSPIDSVLRSVLNQMETDSARRATATTGSDGRFVFSNLQPGTYRV